MLVFATSDKGGTGRSVTSSNIIYRRALQGGDVCYLDFDFGSPTAGSIFQINTVSRGTEAGGLHSYLRGKVGEVLTGESKALVVRIYGPKREVQIGRASCRERVSDTV